jgi:hypothetical protein
MFERTSDSGDMRIIGLMILKSWHMVNIAAAENYFGIFVTDGTC